MNQPQPMKKLHLDLHSRTFQIIEIVVVAIMPFLYGAATRLPFIYYVIHLNDQFELDWLPIGLSVGAYQGCRAITSALAIYSPKMAHLLGNSVGLFGFIVVYVSDDDSLAPFIAGTAVVGMSETMSCIQQYIKEIYKNHPDPKKSRLRMKDQYAFVMLGVVFTFLLGGFTYQYYDINGVAIFGIVLQSLSLIAYFLFLWLLEKTMQEVMVNDDEVTSLDVIKDKNTDEEDSGNGHFDSSQDSPEQVSKSTSMLIISEGDDEDDEVNDSIDKDRQGSNLSSPSKNNGNEHEEVEDKENDNYVKDTQNYDDSNDVDDVIIAEDMIKGKGTTSNTRENKSLNIQLYLEDERKEVPKERRRQSRLSSFASSLKKRLSSLIGHAHTQYTTCDLPATWVNWLLCFTFGIQALTIGFTLGIGPIFIRDEFDKGTDIIGILFSIGATFGSILAILVTCTSFGSILLMKIALPPFDLCFVMGGIAVGVFVACIPSFAVHVIGLIVVMCFNDLGVTIMTELQASITTVSNFSVLGPLGQVIGRSLNVVTALTGPVLYGINPRFPYYVAGSTTLCWTIMLIILFRRRLEKTVEVICDMTGRNKTSVMYRMSYATEEQVYSMATANPKKLGSS